MPVTSIRLPDVYIDAKEMLKNNIDSNNKLSLRTYGAMFSNLADITHYSIAEVEDQEGYANLDLTITYKYRKMSMDDQFILVEKTRNLKVLCNYGDNQWTYRMINKIWEGDYPSTVAYDVESGEVFLFNLKLNRIELVEFGKLEGTAFESVKEELHDREPFKIVINPEAMFNFIDESEGINHLKRNVVIEFNCGVPVRVENIGSAVI